VIRWGAALLLLVVLASGAVRLLDPETWLLARATAALGPVSGWRCAHLSSYVYEPTREQPDSALLADPPEAVVQAAIPNVVVERVEAGLRGGDTLVSVRAAMIDGEEQRVYVLSPGRLQALTLDIGGARTTVCNAHLGDWRIVGEQSRS
jgi:hypothetical protein